jgi:hypothetical protein
LKTWPDAACLSACSAQPVVQQIPVQHANPRVRMAGRATLPLLETQRGVVEEHLAFTLWARRDIRPQRHRTSPGIALRGEIDRASLRSTVTANPAICQPLRPMVTICIIVGSVN